MLINRKENLVTVIRKYHPFVIAVCRKYCTQANLWVGEAEDLAQITWLKILKCKKKPSIDAEDTQWRKFLSVVAVNVCRDNMKGARRRKVRERLHFYKAKKRSAADVLDTLRTNLLAADIQLALNEHCTPQMREVMCHALNEVSLKEISFKLGLSTKTVKRIFIMARKTLYRVLLEWGWSFD
jgi:RNA polymerase sigma factor (sigma-70 family)